MEGPKAPRPAWLFTIPCSVLISYVFARLKFRLHTVKLCLCRKCGCHRPTHQPACVTGPGSVRSVQTRAEDLTDDMVSSPTKMPPPAIHTRFCSTLCGASFILVLVGSWSDLRTAAQSHHVRLTDRFLPATDPKSRASTSTRLQFASPVTLCRPLQDARTPHT